MHRAGRTALFPILALALLLAGAASARTERLRWTHSGPGQVDNFRVYWGPGARNYTSNQDVGIPPTDAEGAYFFDLEVPDDATIYAAVTAWENGLESPFSNERVRASATEPPPEPPPTEEPPPEPPPGGASAAVVGFVLWDASNGTILDGDFVSGEQIDTAVHGCTAIEIVGNAYLNQAGSPGSVMRSLDGQTSACTTGGVTHENEPPYAWEEDFGEGSFACATSLTQAGAHSLTVTPFDGDNCTGAQGAAVTLDFEVIDGTPAPPPPPPEDAPPTPPGRPILILQ